MLARHGLGYAQEENQQVVVQGQKYIDFKIKSLDKYNSRLEKQQHQLLARLKKREKKLANKLQRTDSAAYVKYQQQTLSYDSISRLSKADTGMAAAKIVKEKNSLTDSLKGIAAFMQSHGATAPQVQDNNAGIAKLQGQLNYKSYINDLITQRTNNLKSLGATSNIPILTGIEKQVYYEKAKMNVFKQMEEDPSKAEDKAMEYLQGTEGFDKTMNSTMNGGTGSMQTLTGNESAADLAKMGFQTKSGFQSSLQQKFGGNLSGVTKQMSGQLSQYQSKTSDITGNIKQTKASLSSLKHTDKPDFKVNPMRKLPFWKRIEKQYNWQTTRATTDGLTPALLNLSAMAGYKQSAKLTYGLGLVSSFGLGQSWQNIHFSFQGLGLRTYATWQWEYGIGAYTGYERMYKQAVFTGANQSQVSATTITDPTPHNTGSYNESVLVGLTKSYNINSKWNGQLQVLYDVWWQEKGLRSPIVLRFATISK